MSILATLALTQCSWHEPRYEARYEGPAYPRRYHRDPIFGDPFYGYTALRCVAASPLWARLHEIEASECYLSAAEPVETPSTETVVVKPSCHRTDTK